MNGEQQPGAVSGKTEDVLVGPSAVHLVGGETGRHQQFMGTHRSVCGMVFGVPATMTLRRLYRRKLCGKCIQLSEA